MTGGAAAATSHRSRFRKDIEGLRAISVLAVLLWHAGLPWLPGGYVGVDVFFVISGYLMTTILVGEAEREGTIALSRFYARRARRLLPAALSALLGTALLTLTLLPSGRWGQIGADIVASAAYVVNWTLAGGSVDYLAQEEAPSPLQHFWSLAVEEQFYLVWPLLLLALVALARRRGRADRVRGYAWALTVLVFAVSLALSVHLTATSSASAYFVTHTRAWELALGGFVALGAGLWPRLRPALAATAGWIGLALVLWSIATFSSATPFPGWHALLPTVGAALILVAGPAAGPTGPVAVLAPAPMQFTGRISYSLYLWHWPFVVVALELFGTGHDVRIRYGLLAVAVSVVPAWLSWKYVEEPVRLAGVGLDRGRWTARSLRLGLNCSLVGVVAGLTLQLATWPVPPQEEPTWAVSPVVQTQRDPFGAMLLGADPTASPEGKPVDDPGPTNPPLDAVAADQPAFIPQGCNADLLDVEVGECLAGDPDADTLVVVVGDSHAGQWNPALDSLGHTHGWRVVTMMKSSCPFAPGLEFTRAGESGTYWQCTQWNEGVQDRIEELQPDLVLASNARYPMDGAELAVAMARGADFLAEQEIPFVVLRDTPRPQENMADCVLAHPTRMTACAFPREQALEQSGRGQAELIELRPEVPLIDLTDYICPGDRCPAVIGGVAVFRDSNHLSNTYVSSLTPALEDALVPLVEESTGTR
ncbi:acyltransferase family protein [Ornithinicoccus hortensis]|uniref:Peptidoglycan/LPS O-acetylase OafA/YrhL n=1 Tax=Ornithinicoccus hortensis TaxID=82346 RepID=A0A542YMY9_9MICO|nr:acyltransferase family protein [Ornithinicoccus hortensis]TQL49421.1 peptidoglycan/LPS O-acetylase OafA/YrhL [Ornithinicoccus hortensis]